MRWVCDSLGKEVKGRRVFDKRWYILHPVTCILVGLVLGTMAWLNFQCRIFFGPGGTSVLRFSNGWPFSYREAPVPGPGQLQPNPDSYLPNFIWGHPEFNDNVKIMKRIDGEIGDFPRRPWQLHHFGRLLLVSAIMDLIVTVALIVLVACASEIIVHDNDFQIDNHASFSVTSLLVLLACVPLMLTPQGMPYAIAALLSFAIAIAGTAQVLWIGYRNT